MLQSLKNKSKIGLVSLLMIPILSGLVGCGGVTQNTRGSNPAYDEQLRSRRDICSKSPNYYSCIKSFYGTQDRSTIGDINPKYKDLTPEELEEYKRVEEENKRQNRDIPVGQNFPPGSVGRPRYK